MVNPEDPIIAAIDELVDWQLTDSPAATAERESAAAYPRWVINGPSSFVMTGPHPQPPIVLRMDDNGDGTSTVTYRYPESGEEHTATYRNMGYIDETV